VICPKCHTQGIRVSDVVELTEEAAWWVCPDNTCDGGPWQERGRRGRPGERAPIVDELVSLNAEALERADWHGRTST
jgi:hypothetical protein